MAPEQPLWEDVFNCDLGDDMGSMYCDETEPQMRVQNGAQPSMACHDSTGTYFGEVGGQPADPAYW